MSDIQQRIADILREYGLCEGDILDLPEVLVSELGLTRDERTLADGMAGMSTNYKTGETTVHSRPCTRQSRYATQWVSDD